MHKFLNTIWYIVVLPLALIVISFDLLVYNADGVGVMTSLAGVVLCARLWRIGLIFVAIGVWVAMEINPLATNAGEIGAYLITMAIMFIIARLVFYITHPKNLVHGVVATGAAYGSIKGLQYLVGKYKYDMKTFEGKK